MLRDMHPWRRLWQWIRRHLQRPHPVSQITRSPRATPAVPAASPPSPSARPPRRDLALHLGIDFGTRYTKVCFRDRGRDRSEVVTFTNEQASAENALLRSYVALQGDRIVTGLTDYEWGHRRREAGTVDIDFLKMRLAHLDLSPADGDWQLASIAQCDSHDRLEAVAAFFLARVIDRSCRWIGEARQDLLIGRSPQWSFSIGVPVKYAHSAALRRFERVLRIAAAWGRRGVPDSITLDDARATVRELERVSWTTEATVQAEIAAAVKSFISSPRALEGVYLYFDVGAGTLDGASFRFYRPPEAASQITFYSGEVEQLGVAAVASLVASSTGMNDRDVEDILGKPDARNKLGNVLDVPEHRIQGLITKVIVKGRDIERPAWNSGLEELARAFHRRRTRGAGAPATIPLFIGGGGSNSPFYRDTILRTYDDRPLAAAGVRRYHLEEVPRPEELSMSGLSDEYFHRFTVAYGLSIPPEEGSDVELLPPDPDPPRRRAGPPAGTGDYLDSKELV